MRAPQYQSRIRRRSSRTTAISALLFLSGVMILFQAETTSTLRRALSRSAKRSYETCDVSTISIPSQPILPVYAASYPGSGAQMTHYLYEALTGLESGDEWLHRGDTYDHVAIKTHYPSKKHQIEGSRLMQRAILLLRNPLHSIPSYHNFRYEMDNGIPNHTTKAPEEAWIKWRDEHFDKELMAWKKHLVFWVKDFESSSGNTSVESDSNRLIISYERLVDSKTGPVESTRIANFLARTEGVQVVPPSQIPCVWDKVVNYKRIDVDEDGNEILEENRNLAKGGAGDSLEIIEPTVNRNLYDEQGKILARNERNNRSMVKRRVKYVSPDDPAHPVHSRREGDQVYSFSRSQLEKIRSTLNGLRGRFLEEYTLVVILSGYIEDVEEELKKLK